MNRDAVVEVAGLPMYEFVIWIWRGRSTYHNPAIDFDSVCRLCYRL